MTAVAFTIPGEPRGKGRPRFGKGFTYTDDKTASYEGTIKLACRQAMRGCAPFAGPVIVTVKAVLSIPKSASQKKRAGMIEGDIRPVKRPDLDNITKAVLDGCNKVAFADDAQGVSCVSSKLYGETPGVEVMVCEIGEKL